MSSTKQLQIILESIKKSGQIDKVLFDNLSDDEKELVKTLYEKLLVDEALKILKDLDIENDWNQVLNKFISSKKPVRQLWRPVLKYVSIFVGILVSVYFFGLYQDKTPLIKEVTEHEIKLKTGEKAVKIINQAETGQIVSASGQVLGKQEGNKIIYNSNSNIEELIFNELEIPYGKIFELELSDGTLVHLNSGTTIRYPVRFVKGNKREVFIDGEAYFKVTKDVEHPFIVNAADVEVEVLGTEFNISSYQEDANVRTVLVEGSVSIRNSLVQNEGMILKPGYMGSWNKTSNISNIKEVEIDLYTGWIKGELIFRKSSFTNMIKKLERSYNVSIENNNLLLNDKKFNASFSVNIENIENVLQSLNKIHPFQYRINDQEIIIN